MMDCPRNTAGTHQTDSKWSWFVCVSAMLGEGLYMSFMFSFAIMLPVFISEFNESRQNVAWVGSMTLSFTFLATPFSAVCCARFGYRTVAALGALICAVSLVASSFAKSLLPLYFTFGIFYGVGSNIIHTSGYLITTRYFVRRRAFATGLVASAPCLFLLGMGPFVQLLNTTVGWRNTLRVIASLFLFVIVFVLISYAPNVEEKRDGFSSRHFLNEERSVQTSNRTLDKRIRLNKHAEGESRQLTSSQELNDTTSTRPMVQTVDKNKQMSRIDCSIWRIPTYTIVVICAIVEGFGVYAPFIHLVKHCEEVGISSQKASTLLIYIGVSSLVGRIVSGRLCDLRCVSALILHQLADVVVGTSMLLIWLARNYLSFSVFAIFYGLGNGFYLTTLFYLLLNTIRKPKQRPLAFGMGEFLHGISCAIGSGIAGLVADEFDSYIRAFYMTGGVVLISALFPFALHCFDKRTHSSAADNIDCGLTEYYISSSSREELVVCEMETVL